jgi:hypothetical protein
MGMGVSDWLHLIPREVRSDLVDAYWFEQTAEENGKGGGLFGRRCNAFCAVVM